jgi:hypothetical protein
MSDARRGPGRRPNVPALAAGMYMAAVVAGLVLAFDFDGRVDMSWWLALFVLTLPWSFVSILFMWALIHETGLGFFTMMYLIFGALNAFIIYRIGAAVRGQRARGRG